MAKLTPAEKQKNYRERKKATAPPNKTTNRFPTAGPVSVAQTPADITALVRRLELLEALMKAQERRIQDLEDGRAPEPVLRAEWSDGSISHHPKRDLDGLRDRIAAVTPHGSTRSLVGSRFVNGIAARTCCQSLVNQPHADTCTEVG